MLKKMVQVSFLAFTTVVAISCGGSSGLGGCTRDAQPGVCLDSVGSSHTPASVRAACEATSGTYVTGQCPTASLIGSCTAGAAATRVVYRYYDDFSGTADDAQNECSTINGVWAPN